MPLDSLGQFLLVFYSRLEKDSEFIPDLEWAAFARWKAAIQAVLFLEAFP